MLYKDKNSKPLNIDDEVSILELTYKIKEFKIYFKGVVACGDHGCFLTSEIEKVEKEEKEEKSEEN